MNATLAKRKLSRERNTEEKARKQDSKVNHVGNRGTTYL